MLVEAIKIGFDRQFLRQVGEKFEIDDAVNEAGEVIAFSKVRMKKVESPKNQHTPNAAV